MPGWIATLRRDGRRVIALDNRGHGQSAKLYDPADYHTDMMAGDVAALIEHLGLARADVMGYSLGSRISAVLAARHPELVRSVILGGVGIRLVDSAGLRDEIARLARSAVARRRDRSDGQAFRAFAEQTARICARSPPACAARARRCGCEDIAASARPRWSRSAPRTTSPARRTSSPR